MGRTFQRKVSYVVLGAGATGLLLSGLTGLSAAGANSDLNDITDKSQSETLSPQDRDRFNDKLDERDDLLSATYVLLGVGSALAVTGGLLYYMDNPRAEAYEPPPGGPGETSGAVPVAVAPVVGPDFAGLSVAGRF